MGLETFLFQKRARGWHNDCLLCENLSSSIHGRWYFVPCYFQLMFTLLHETDETACYMFKDAPWKSFYANLPFEQPYCDILRTNSLTLAPWHTKSQEQMLVASKAVFLENYLVVSTWILNGSSIGCLKKKYQPFSLAGVRFGSLVNQISGLKSDLPRRGLCLTLLLCNCS